MSILIKGMDMPRSCHSCCFFGQAYIWESDFDGYTKSFCKRTGSQTFDYVENFLPNCPLVPVPPHGRLIDADAIPYSKLMFLDDDYYYGTTKPYIDRMPAIIEAEEATQKDGGQDEAPAGPYDLLYEEGGADTR